MKQHLSHTPGPIGVFDSGYGGLTILNKIREALPEYDYVYLGDNARTPYGTRSFEIVYEFTLQAVNKLFEMGCHLVILACNTASAKALRSIQMNDLPGIDPERRVLGVIRPTVECIGDITQSRHIGVLATAGTIKSESYPLEIHKLFPDIQVSGMACPMWVPLVENNESQNEGADYFIRKYIDQLLSKDPEIDTMILGCTHYPILLPKIQAYPHCRTRRICSRKSEGLPEQTPGNECQVYPKRQLSVLHHRGGREVYRIGLFVPEPANRRKKNFSRINMGKLINLSFFFVIFVYITSNSIRL